MRRVSSNVMAVCTSRTHDRQMADVIRGVTNPDTCGYTGTRCELAARRELPVQITSGHAPTLTLPTEGSGEVDLAARLDDELRGRPRGGLSSVLPLLNPYYPARGESKRYEVLPLRKPVSLFMTCEHPTCKHTGGYMSRDDICRQAQYWAHLWQQCGRKSAEDLRGYTRNLLLAALIVNHNTCLLEKQSHACHCKGARILIRRPAPYTTRWLRVCPGSEFFSSTSAWQDICNASGWCSTL